MSSLHWFQIIVSLAVHATAITLVACAVERRCRSSHVKARVWTCYYVSLLGLLAAGLLLPRAHWVNPWQRLGDQQLIRVVGLEQSAATMLLAAWATGLGVLAIQWGLQFVRLQRFLGACRVATSQEMQIIRAAASAELLKSAGRAVEFRVCPEELGPFCYQLHRPAVYLPPSLLAGNRSELQHVLEHELTHLQTQHPLQLFMQRIVQTSLWFVPAIWSAGRRASLAREFVCDDAAVGRGASPANYLRTLLRYATAPGQTAGTPLAIARSSSELRVRAERLATREPNVDGPLAAWAPSLILLASLAASQLWLPTNPLASPKSNYSPWPVWSAATLHAFDVSARDFDEFDSRLHWYELTNKR